MLFCDTGNNAVSVMALGRFEVVWYDKEVSVQ